MVGARRVALGAIVSAPCHVMVGMAVAAANVFFLHKTSFHTFTMDVESRDGRLS